MNEIYPMWVAAHGVMIVCPVNWYQAPSSLKLMIDRLVCADGGNPDPTSTSGKNAEKAKEIELAGWPYPRHLAGRVFSVVVHGDAAGAENLRRMLVDWMSDIGMIPSGHLALLDRYVGYLAPYATSHDDLDRDTDFQEDVRNAARTLVQAVKDRRSGQLEPPDRGLHGTRPKQAAEGLLRLNLGAFGPLRIVMFKDAQPDRKPGKQKRQSVFANEFCSVSERCRANRYDADCHDQDQSRFQNLRVRPSARQAAEAVSDMYDADAGHCELESAEECSELYQPNRPQADKTPN